MDDDRGADFSEITILPDGRVFVFGLTQPLLELLAHLPAQDNRWQSLADEIRTTVAHTDFAGEIP